MRKGEEEEGEGQGEDKEKEEEKEEREEFDIFYNHIFQKLKNLNNFSQMDG